MAAWFDTHWAYRRAVSVDATAVPSSLTQYQVQIALTSTNFAFAHALSDGSDIRVTFADGITLCPYYISAFSSGSQTATIWVRIPAITAGSTVTLYVYYGNATPAVFALPPTGLFTHPTSSVHTGLGENIVFDPVSNAYYLVYTTLTDGSGVNLSTAATPGGPWTDLGTILPVSGSGWDSFGCYAPHLLLSAGVWYLYYSGEVDNAGNSHSIGYATASVVTGPYTRSGSNPVVTYTGTATFDRYRACEPFVYFSTILNEWVLLYMGDAGLGATQVETVGMATASSPGGPWTKVAGNPILPLGAAGSWYAGTVADPFVVEMGGVAYLFVTTSPLSTQGYQVGFFTTTDYIHFQEGWVVHSYGFSDDWDVSNGFRGAVIQVGNSWYLSYTAGAGTWAWAVSSMSALSTAAGFDPNQVFDFADFFAGSSLDLNHWHVFPAAPGGVASVSGGVANMITAVNGQLTISSRRGLFGPGAVAEVVCQSVNANTSGNHATEVGFSDVARANLLRFFDNSNADWQIGSTTGGSSTNALLGQAIDTAYHTRRVQYVSPTAVNFQLDNNTPVQITTNIPATNAPSVVPLWLFAFAAGGLTTSLNITSVIVRRYSSVEPTLTVGGESTNGAFRRTLLSGGMPEYTARLHG